MAARLRASGFVTHHSLVVKRVPFRPIIPGMLLQNQIFQSRLVRVLQTVFLGLLAISPIAIAQQRTKPQPPKSVRLYVFDYVSLDIPDTSPNQLKKEELNTYKMSVACFLLVDPQCMIVWLAG